MFKVLHTCQEKSPQNPAIKTANIITRFYQYSSRLLQDEISPVFLKVTIRWNLTSIHQGYRFSAFFSTRWNITVMHRGNSFSAFSQKEKISILCPKGTVSQLFPNKRKYQYHAAREQLLSSFPTRENINIMHQGNNLSPFSQQEKTLILSTEGTASQLFPNKNKLF